MFNAIYNWWYPEEEEVDEEEVERQRKEKEWKAQQEVEELRKAEAEMKRNVEYFEHDTITLSVTKPLDPYDEIEITVQVIPKELHNDNLVLQAPTFTFTCVEPDEVLGDGEQVYEGVGTNMPERIFIMKNRDYNLSVANHADKWAVFWLFTIGTACLPHFLQRRSEKSF